MSEPRKHHFVPAFFLKQWANPAHGNQVTESAKLLGKLVQRWRSEGATGWEYDLYAFQELPPHQRQHIEKVFFNYADNTGSQALTILLEEKRGAFSPELRRAWSRFLVGLYLRHPDIIPELRIAARAIWARTGDRTQADYEHLRSAEDPPLFDQYVASVDPLIPDKAQMNLIINGIDNDQLCAFFDQMEWSVLDLSNASRTLLLSDRPLMISDLKQPTGLLALPISPNKLFLAVNHNSTAERIASRPNSDIVRHSNVSVVTKARRFVWSIDRSQATFIERHMSTNMEPLPLLPNTSKLGP